MVEEQARILETGPDRIHEEGPPRRHIFELNVDYYERRRGEGFHETHSSNVNNDPQVARHLNVGPRCCS